MVSASHTGGKNIEINATTQSQDIWRMIVRPHKKKFSPSHRRSLFALSKGNSTGATKEKEMIRCL